MKTYLLPSFKITIILMVLCAGIYPLIISAIGKLAPGGGDGEKVMYDGRVVGYAAEGQRFTKDGYFWSRPSAADYKADAGAGSNKGPSNPDHIKDVEKRISEFLKRNPGVKRAQIPAELVTASGSGLDPDISPAGAYIQALRVAKARSMSAAAVAQLINKHTEQPLLGLFGPAKVNVLKINVALDEMQK